MLSSLLFVTSLKCSVEDIWTAGRTVKLGLRRPRPTAICGYIGISYKFISYKRITYKYIKEVLFDHTQMMTLFTFARCTDAVRWTLHSCSFTETKTPHLSLDCP